MFHSGNRCLTSMLRPFFTNTQSTTAALRCIYTSEIVEKLVHGMYSTVKPLTHEKLCILERTNYSISFQNTFVDGNYFSDSLKLQ